MTTQEAKQILLAYRPWTDDARDPEVAEALALCEQDADMAKWLKARCATQEAIRIQFRRTPLPEGLKEQIVSEFKSRNLVVWWRRPAVMVVAAVLALLIAVSSLWFSAPRSLPEDVSFAAYRSRMIRTATRAYGMDLETNDVVQIRAYLAQHKAPADYVIPDNLAQAQSAGCGVLSWQGKPVTMVCFRTGKPLDPGAKSDLFLFVIDQKDLEEAPAFAAPEFANVSTLATASWINGGKVYVLAAPDESDLRRRL